MLCHVHSAINCHKYDPPHLARHCKAIHETCATCASINHRTAECPVTERDDFCCVNCDHALGHAAWEKSCPAYQRALKKLRARRPDAGFRFFPLADDPYTWESVEGGENLFPEGGWQRRVHRSSKQLSRSPHTVPSSQRSGGLLSDLIVDAIDSIDGVPLSPTVAA